MNRNSLVWLLRNIWQSWLSRVDCLVQSSGCKNKLNSELQQIRWVCLLQTSCKMYPVISFLSFSISTMHTLFFIWSQFIRNQCFAESQVNSSGTKKMELVLLNHEALWNLQCSFLKLRQIPLGRENGTVNLYFWICCYYGYHHCSSSEWCI